MRLLTTAGVLALCGTASAAIEFDQDVTNEAIFGSGNDNGSFTTDRNAGVELGLRAKLRFDATNQPDNIFNSNGDGTYSFAPGLPPTGFGFAPGSSSTAVWNFEWSINSDFDGSSSDNLDDLTYELGIDFDRSLGTNYLAFDPINAGPADHAIGTNATANGAGTVDATPAGYAALIANNNLAQNSWNMEFFNGPGFPFNGAETGVYDFYLVAFDGNGSEVARTEMRVLVPTPGAVGLAALAGLGALRRRR